MDWIKATAFVLGYMALIFLTMAAIDLLPNWGEGFVLIAFVIYYIKITRDSIKKSKRNPYL